MKQKTPLEEAFDKYLEDNKHIRLATPSIKEKSDKELKRDLFNKMLRPYIKIAISSAEKREQDRIIQVISKYGFFNPNSKLIKEIKKLI